MTEKTVEPTEEVLPWPGRVWQAPDPKIQVTRIIASAILIAFLGVVGGPGGFACGTCGGTGYFVYDKPKRDYEAAGRRAFEAGKPLAANPYRYGWPSHGWMLGWIDASDDAKKVPASQRLDLLMPNAGDKPPQVGLD